MPLGWEQVIDYSRGVYYINHVESKCCPWAGSRSLTTPGVSTTSTMWKVSAHDHLSVAVPVPTLEKFWFRFRIQKIFSTVFQKQKVAQNLAFSMSSEAGYFPESWPLILIFRLFFITFHVGSGSKCCSGTEMHSGLGSAKAKSSGSCGSFLVPVSAPQHWISWQLISRFRVSGSALIWLSWIRIQKQGNLPKFTNEPDIESFKGPLYFRYVDTGIRVCFITCTRVPFTYMVIK
jgi:hypothetical protein